MPNLDSGREGRSGAVECLAAVPSPRARRRRQLRRILGVLGALIALGWALGLLGDPFILILYVQLAFLAYVIFLFIELRRDYYALAVLLGFCAAYGFDKVPLAIILGALFFVLLIGRSVLDSRFVRIIYTWASFALAAAVFLAFFVESNTKTVGDRSIADRFADVENMDSLPYQSSVEDERHENENGVIDYYRKATAQGLNLYNSYYQVGAALLDMDGTALHTWHPAGTNPQWHFVTLCDNGDLLACIEDTMILRMNWNSQVLWQRSLRAHHEIAVAENGDIYTLASEEEVVRVGFLPVPIINDYIVVLSADGAVKKRISVFDLLKRELRPSMVAAICGKILNPRDFLWKAIKMKVAGRPLMERLTPFDVLHGNAITLADRNIDGVCRRGDLLISACALNLVGVVDVELGTMRWTWGPGQLEGQHAPTFLENGDVLIFDNGTQREYTRLVELDPRTGTIVWEYHSLHPTPFYTSWGGAAQRFGNGNTLVTESDKGRVFEITKDGQLVWEFFNPSRAQDGKRATIYRMTRITDPRMRVLLMNNIKAES